MRHSTGSRKEQYGPALDLLVAKGAAEITLQKGHDPAHFKEGLSRWKDATKTKGTLFFSSSLQPSGEYKMEITLIESDMGRKGRGKKTS